MDYSLTFNCFFSKRMHHGIILDNAQTRRFSEYDVLYAGRHADGRGSSCVGHRGGEQVAAGSVQRQRGLPASRTGDDSERLPEARCHSRVRDERPDAEHGEEDGSGSKHPHDLAALQAEVLQRGGFCRDARESGRVHEGGLHRPPEHHGRRSGCGLRIRPRISGYL